MTRETIKTIAELVSSFATGCVATLFLKENVHPTKRIEKVATALGSMILSDMVASKSSKYVGNVCDQIFLQVDKFQESLDKVNGKKALNNDRNSEEECTD